MKLPQFLIVTAPCLLLAYSAQAQNTPLTTLDWKFNTLANPAPPTAAGTTNLTGGAATATFVQGVNSYIAGSGPGGLYGPPTGLWAMDWAATTPPELELKLDQTPVTSVDLTLTVTHFVDNAQYPGTLSFSLPNAVAVGRQVVIPQTGNMIGFWAADTYSWAGVTYPAWGDANGAPITLDLFPGLGNGSLLLDEVKLSILGAVSTVPEPMAGQLAGLGLLLFGLRSWLRRKA